MSLRKLSSDATPSDEREKSGIETGDVSTSVEREIGEVCFELRLLSRYPMGDCLSRYGLTELLEELEALENIGEAIDDQSFRSVRFVDIEYGVADFVDVTEEDCFQWWMGVLVRISVVVGIPDSSSLGDGGPSSDRLIDQEEELSSVDPLTDALF